MVGLWQIRYNTVQTGKWRQEFSTLDMVMIAGLLFEQRDKIYFKEVVTLNLRRELVNELLTLLIRDDWGGVAEHRSPTAGQCALRQQECRLLQQRTHVPRRETRLPRWLLIEWSSKHSTIFTFFCEKFNFSSAILRTRPEKPPRYKNRTLFVESEVWRRADPLRQNIWTKG